MVRNERRAIMTHRPFTWNLNLNMIKIWTMMQTAILKKNKELGEQQFTYQIYQKLISFLNVLLSKHV